jgi:hypothetical protein
MGSTCRMGLVMAAMAMALWCASPTSRAEAQTGWSNASLRGPDLGSVLWPLVIGGSVVGAAAVGLTVADVVSFSTGRRFDEGWAIVEIVFGGLSIAGSAVSLSYLATTDGGLSTWIAGVAVGGIALGGLQITHAAWSLGGSRGPAPPIAPVVTPMAGGAFAGLTGSF